MRHSELRVLKALDCRNVIQVIQDVKISYITKVVDFYKSDGFNAIVTIEGEKTCIIDGHGTTNKKMLIADYKFQVEEEVEDSGANWFLGKLKHRKIELISFGTPPLKGEHTQCPTSSKLKKKLDLLRRQITWN